jgi:ATP-dependent RNA helicase SUPV3L1/SUV3
MAKTKKKHQIKLNNTVRGLFKGRPFDTGIETLDDTLLMELVMLAQIPLDDHDRPSMLRALRRVWSEKDFRTREAIVAHLRSRLDPRSSRRAAARTAASAPHDTVDRILSHLLPLEPTDDEQEAILSQFMESPPNRITAKRVTNALHWYRRKQRIAALERALDVTVDAEGRLEWYAPFRFTLPEHDFTKTLQVLTPPLAWDDLSETDDLDALIAYASERKAAAEKARQAEVDRFCTQLFAREHPYLDPEQIVAHLKRMPPEGDLIHTPIDFMVCEQIVHRLDPEARLIVIGSTYAVEKARVLPLRHLRIPYRIRSVYDAPFCYGAIWRGEPLGIRDDLEAVDRQTRAHFEVALDDLLSQARDMARGLDVDEATLWEHIHPMLTAQLQRSDNLKIQPKTIRRILYHLGEYLRPLREKKMREALLAQTIRDFKRLFPLARELKRRIVFHAGPTNSGKTYAAMERLRAAQTGYYLAPLRLLALEGYEALKHHGIAASLITGEEEILAPDTTHISSTIEMLNFEADVACCVIDEIQMIADRDRGWAWANALIGAPAQTVILTGSADAIPAVREIAEYLGEPLEIVPFERKNPLELLRTPVPLKKIKPHTAIVAFSRKEVLSFRQRLSAHHRVSVVYGNLSPEVRREEARKFREGETDVLVATDAIAMGLNLPIRTLLFARDNKFDGLKRRELTANEVLQIAGRAGRYGLHESGFIGALDGPTLETIGAKLHSELPPIELPVTVMASLHHVMLIGEILETDMLVDILTFFADNMEFEGPFRAANIESMLEIAAIVDAYDLDLRSRYHLSTAPVGIHSPYLESVFHRYLKYLEEGRPIPYLAPKHLPEYAQTNDELLLAEDRVKEVSLYLWLHFRFAELFPDTEAALRARALLNRFIETSLTRGNFVKRCRRCGAPLDLSYRYSICERCYRRSGHTNTKRPKRKER